VWWSLWKKHNTRIFQSQTATLIDIVGKIV
jgi:hypothetical protein